jgi:acetate kinase
VADAILVLNAGSSSLKFEVFLLDGGDLARAEEGLLEELHDRPRFVVRDAAGGQVAERRWG